MDKIILAAAVIAIVAIVAVTMVLNPFSSLGTDSPATDAPDDGTDLTPSGSNGEPDDEPDVPDDRPEINVDESTIEDIIAPTVEGDCDLYKHVAKNRWECFGTAGNYSKVATNEYRPADSDTYFCKPTEYGCRLYQKVDFQLG